MSNDKSAMVSYEQQLAELETIVRMMESGELPLEDALKAYEYGVALVRQCQQTLDAAEQKVYILSGTNDQTALQPFEPES